MKFFIITVSVILLFTSILLAQEERKVLVEIFTNSHCPLCPPAHEAIENYLHGSNGDKISYLFYHMIYPYQDDSLYYQSQEGSDARDEYYNPVQATPQGWFDGVHQGSTSGWASTLDNLVATGSPLKINLTGTKSGSLVSINAELTRTGNIPDNDLVLHFVVAENLYFAGRNGITNHIHVMRKMLPTPDGLSLTINLNETKDLGQNIILDPFWNADSLSFVVFVQSTASKTVYQSGTINYPDLVVSVNDEPGSKPDEFVLFQNYPNPFNPTTVIKYSIPVETQNFASVQLKVFDILGREVATIVNEELPAGEYEVTFSATNWPSGIYFYILKAGSFMQTKKMILIK